MAGEDNRTFGQLLRRHRLAAHLTQEELAEKAHLSRRAIQDLERGSRRQPRRATVQLLAGALDLSDAAQSFWLTSARQARTPGPHRQSPRSPRSSLPVSLTTFVGRGQQVQDLVGLLGSARLITLVGSGGVGKTRLALRVASEVFLDYADGVHVVELAPLTEPALVIQALAAAFHVVEQPSHPLVELVEARLQTAHTLVVLDNCEHLVDAAGDLTDVLLRACPSLHILATSREPLRVESEIIWRVPSLSVPVVDASASTDALLEAESVQLFVERAAAAQPGFALTHLNRLAIAQVCQRLDGIPLAIELAAAWLSTLAPREIAARLDEPLWRLTKNDRGVPARQQTMRATVEWSYGLLEAPEQALFNRVSVFQSGWTLDAVEAVCAADGGKPSDVLPRLARLVDKSLVIAEPTRDGSIRYRLLETLRQYAAEQLQAAGDTSTTRQRHLEWCLSVAEHAEPQLRGTDQRIWLDRLEVEHDNIRAALDWALATPSALTPGLGLAASLWRFWYIRGHLTEGRRRLDALLAALAEGSGPGQSGTDEVCRLQAKALHGASLLAFNQRDYPVTARLAGESLALWRQLQDQRGEGNSLNTLAMAAQELGELERADGLFRQSLAASRAVDDTMGVANALNNLGEVARYRGDLDRAAHLYQEGLGLMRQLEDKWGIANLTCNLGEVAQDRGALARSAALYQESLALRTDLGDKPGISIVLGNMGDLALAEGNLDRAATLYQQGLALAREIGDSRGIASSLSSLAEVAWLRGEPGRALASHEESLALRRTLGDRRSIAKELIRLGRVAGGLGDLERAAAAYAESLALIQELGDKRTLAQCLVGLASLAGALAQHRRAARLFGAAEALREAIGAALPAADGPMYARSVADERGELGAVAFETEWLAGRRLTARHAVVEALAVAT